MLNSWTSPSTSARRSRDNYLQAEKIIAIQADRGRGHRQAMVFLSENAGLRSGWRKRGIVFNRLNTLGCDGRQDRVEKLAGAAGWNSSRCEPSQ
jgi:hypothetical protein